MTPQTQHILQRVATFIAQEELFTAPSSGGVAGASSQLVLVGLSGGADSVALLHILQSLGYRCRALHCNFHLRGRESDRDEDFCRALCQRLHIPLSVQSFPTHAYMAQHHLSPEMAARRLRYDWWQEVSAQYHAPIAIGHHLDDSIETLLMNLMRGTGIQGLTGIVARNEQKHVIRPLLCLQRADILTYLGDNSLGYVTDSTNFQNDTLRNQIRNQVLPLMEQILPHTRQGLISSMQHLQGTQHFAEQFLSQADQLTRHFSQWGIEWHEILLSDIKKAFPLHTEDYIYHWEKRFGPGPKNGIKVCRDAIRLYTCPSSAELIQSHRPTLIAQEVQPTAYRTSAGSLTQQFDASTIQMPLTLRRYQPGDRMAPLGLGGHTKLLSDLFQNAHYSPMQKATTWLVCDATGAIIWASGLRISDLHKVTEHTQHVLQITLE